MPKTVLDKVVEAIKLLDEPGGASRVAIAKAVASAHGDVKAPLLKRALQQGMDKGVLQQGLSNQRFALAGTEVKAREGATVTKTVLKEGSGRPCEWGDTVDMAYVGKLSDGTRFDSAKHFEFRLGAGDVIKGWDEGVIGMKVGEKAQLVVPPSLGYGKRGSGPKIPGDSTLHFTLTVNHNFSEQASTST